MIICIIPFSYSIRCSVELVNQQPNQAIHYCLSIKTIITVIHNPHTSAVFLFLLKYIFLLFYHLLWKWVIEALSIKYDLQDGCFA
jgi:hypothetical protein